MKLDRINVKEAFRYIGYGSSTPDDNVLSIAEECERLLLEVIDAKYVYRYFRIEEICTSDTTDRKAGIILDGCDLALMGNSISEHLKGCEGAVLFAVTLSEGVDRLIRRLELSSMASAVIVDSMASAAIEQVCDIAEQEILEKLSGRYATWRFSPGYGDFPIESQKKFLEVLSASKRIGVNITQGGLMTPCKSVTAVMGISDREVDRKRRGCSVCSMRESCAFRRKGEHCGV